MATPTPGTSGPDVPEVPDVLTELRTGEARGRLAAVAPRLAQVADCRFFGGRTDVGIAEALDITRRTVQEDWAKARILLRRALSS